jgi:hypothetical protein
MDIVFVSANELQKKFNDGGFAESATNGELIQERIKESHPAPNCFPHCTRSQIISYRENKRGSNGKRALVAIVHQYKLPNGKIGASGKPDPKYLKIGNVVYKLES